MTFIYQTNPFSSDIIQKREEGIIKCNIFTEVVLEFNHIQSKIINGTLATLLYILSKHFKFQGFFLSITIIIYYPELFMVLDAKIRKSSRITLLNTI